MLPCRFLKKFGTKELQMKQKKSGKGNSQTSRACHCQSAKQLNLGNVPVAVQAGGSSSDRIDAPPSDLRPPGVYFRPRPQPPAPPAFRGHGRRAGATTTAAAGCLESPSSPPAGPPPLPRSSSSAASSPAAARSPLPRRRPPGGGPPPCPPAPATPPPRRRRRPPSVSGWCGWSPSL